MLSIVLSVHVSRRIAMGVLRLLIWGVRGPICFIRRRVFGISIDLWVDGRSLIGLGRISTPCYAGGCGMVMVETIYGIREFSHLPPRSSRSGKSALRSLVNRRVDLLVQSCAGDLVWRRALDLIR